MKEKLIKLLDNAYSPYSKFCVACIVEMKDKQQFSGVNVENASYGATLCAERNAISTAITNGYKKGDFAKLYVMVASDKISSCCFLCRQVIVEFFDENADVILMSKNNEKKLKVFELCPFPFSESDLK